MSVMEKIFIALTEDYKEKLTFKGRKDGQKSQTQLIIEILEEHSLAGMTRKDLTEKLEKVMPLGQQSAAKVLGFYLPRFVENGIITITYAEDYTPPPRGRKKAENQGEVETPVARKRARRQRDDEATPVAEDDAFAA